MRHQRRPAELLLVPMIDIFTVLVTFLLMTAVFSHEIFMAPLQDPSVMSGGLFARTAPCRKSMRQINELTSLLV